MKKIALFLAIFSFLALAQDNNRQLHAFGVGASIYTKAGLNANLPPNSRQTNFNYVSVPDFYISAYLPYSIENDIGLYGEIGLQNHAYTTTNFNTKEEYSASLSYLMFSPNLYFEGLILGFNLGFPLSSDFGVTEEALMSTDTSTITPDLNTIFEMRFGGSYTIYSDFQGRLTLNLLATVMMNGLFQNYPQSDPYMNIIEQEQNFPVSSFHNPRLFNIQLGISYLFNINIYNN